MVQQVLNDRAQSVAMRKLFFGNWLSKELAQRLPPIAQFVNKQTVSWTVCFYVEIVFAVLGPSYVHVDAVVITSLWA